MVSCNFSLVRRKRWAGTRLREASVTSLLRPRSKELLTPLVQKALSAQRALLIVDNLENVSDERVKFFLYHLPLPTHWAHRKRDDNRLSPAEVLGQETSKLRTPEQLHRIFYATRFLRRLNRLGYVHFRRWKLYGEEALARHPTIIWLHGDALTVEYQETPLAQYTVRYQPDKKHFKEVPEARRFETPYRSLQGRLS